MQAAGLIVVLNGDDSIHGDQANEILDRLLEAY